MNLLEITGIDYEILALKLTSFFQGYSGYGCSNDDNAMSIQFQLVQMMLLTMSNLFFLPAIFIGFYRRYWQETTVYIVAMATSTLYHACDQFGTQKYYCIAPYDTLQFADFLAATVAVSILSLFNYHLGNHCSNRGSPWLTMVHLREPGRYFVFMVVVAQPKTYW